MAIALPTAADVRKARSQANEFVSARYDVVRTPVLAWIGAGDLALHRLREIPDRLTPAELRRRADEVSAQARETYDDWARHGEVTVDRIRSQPTVERVLRSARDANSRLDRQVETVVDQVHDTGEELLGRVSTKTRSVGEKTARRTQKLARDAAENVEESSEELAGEIRAVGDDAARETRSVSRRAANQTQPANGSRAGDR